MAITKELIDGLIVTIQNLYLADDIPWMVGYSGGKDSTAAVQLVWMALEKLPKKDRKKPIHIMNTDTLVESPVVSKWVEKSLESMRIEAEKIDLPIIPERLTPDYNNTFWVNLIGRGYPFPRMKYRWCTDRLKIQPVNNFIKNKIAEHGEIILVLGTRKQESLRRNRTMTNLEKKRVRELLSPNPTLANELVFSPMEDWTDDDVWAFLMQYKNPWKQGYLYPILASIPMGIVAGCICYGLNIFVKSNFICLLVSIPIAAVVYLFTYLIISRPSENELRRIPGGSYLIRIAEKLPFWQNN